jgi:hypothetical protein
VQTYPVGDLLAKNQDLGGLFDLITETVAPGTWDDVGGAGTIQFFPANQQFVINQSGTVHDQIGELLVQLRSERR